MCFGSKGAVALHYAAQENKEDVVLFLLKNGAKVNLQDCKGCTALHYAAYNGAVDAAKILLRYKASTDTKVRWKEMEGGHDRPGTDESGVHSTASGSGDVCEERQGADGKSAEERKCQGGWLCHLLRRSEVGVAYSFMKCPVISMLSPTMIH
eukprot:13751-Hanusia_phi.AAC.2